jgi:hypothetical protein
LSQEPTASIPSACKGWQETKAAYRYFDNPKVDSAAILAPHKAATLTRVANYPRVFVIQDTTNLDYTSQANKQGVGPTRRGHERALLLHPSIVVSESGVCLGVYDDYQYHRNVLLTRTASRQQLSNANLHKKPVSEKESYRWVHGYQQAAEIADHCEKTHVIMLADRESDVYDLFEEANRESNRADWLIRIRITHRALINELGKRDAQLLHQKLAAMPAQQVIKFTLPKRHGEPRRKVQQELRMAQLTLHPPTGRRGKLRCHPVTVTVLLAKEINVPSGETPVNWWLMTNITVVEPQQLIIWYLLRWQIEVFFHILKSGCQVENLQLMTAKRTRTCLAMYLIIARRIFFLASLAKTQSTVTCTNVLEPQEWQTAWTIIKKTKPPEQPPSLYNAIILIAQMGGYLARKSDSPPGPKAMWQGLTQLYHIIHAHELLNEINTYG